MPSRRRFAPCVSNTMLALAFKNLLRRPLRTGLTVGGLGLALAFLLSLLGYTARYRTDLRRELDGMGMQMMLVPLGCPYDGAAQILKGRALDSYLPEDALATARRDAGVSLAAPVFIASIPRTETGRTDMWVGVDPSAPLMRPWWRLASGTFPRVPNDVLLGADAAMTEMRALGDKFYSPETGRALRVCGVLARSGTSDDAQFFVPLATAQAMFKQPGRLTGVALRLHDVRHVPQVAKRLGEIRGAQAVTLSEMMGVFLNLMGAARVLVVAVVSVAGAVAAMSVFNTMLAATLERNRELGVLRAIGWGRGRVFALMSLEAGLLTLAGGIAGLLFTVPLGGLVETLVRPFLPLASAQTSGSLTLGLAALGLGLVTLVGLVAGAYPAWRACRLHPAQAVSGL